MALSKENCQLKYRKGSFNPYAYNYNLSSYRWILGQAGLFSLSTEKEKEKENSKLKPVKTPL